MVDSNMNRRGKRQFKFIKFGYYFFSWILILLKIINTKGKFVIIGFFALSLTWRDKNFKEKTNIFLFVII